MSELTKQVKRACLLQALFQSLRAWAELRGLSTLPRETPDVTLVNDRVGRVREAIDREIDKLLAELAALQSGEDAES